MCNVILLFFHKDRTLTFFWISLLCLVHAPPPLARGQAAVGGAEPWPQVHPGILRGVRAAAGL